MSRRGLFLWRTIQRFVGTLRKRETCFDLQSSAECKWAVCRCVCMKHGWIRQIGYCQLLVDKDRLVDRLSDGLWEVLMVIQRLYGITVPNRLRNSKSDVYFLTWYTIVMYGMLFSIGPNRTEPKQLVVHFYDLIHILNCTTLKRTFCNQSILYEIEWFVSLIWR